jgi:hypothetical protein
MDRYVMSGYTILQCPLLIFVNCESLVLDNLGAFAQRPSYDAFITPGGIPVIRDRAVINIHLVRNRVSHP